MKNLFSLITSLKKPLSQLSNQIISWVQSLPKSIKSTNFTALVQKHYKLLTALLLLLIIAPLAFLYSRSSQNTHKASGPKFKRQLFGPYAYTAQTGPTYSEWCETPPSKVLSIESGHFYID